MLQQKGEAGQRKIGRSIGPCASSSLLAAALAAVLLGLERVETGQGLLRQVPHNAIHAGGSCVVV